MGDEQKEVNREDGKTHTGKPGDILQPTEKHTLLNELLSGGRGQATDKDIVKKK